MEKRTMYHTQEDRRYKLKAPIKCKRSDAWLGIGYYYWDDLQDAHQWGKKSKRKFGKYQIYKSEIDCKNILDTVFNEEHYRFWLKQIEKTIDSIIKNTGKQPTLKQVNNYFLKKATWDTVTGVLFQDLPSNFRSRILIKEGQYFIYRKRIQIAVYNRSIILNFNFFSK